MKIVALTMGEPSSISPELIQKLWSILRQQHDIGFCVVAPQGYLDHSLTKTIDYITDVPSIFPHYIPLLAINGSIEGVTLGKPNPSHTSLIMHSITTAVTLAQEGSVHAIVTLPIHKSSMHQGGFNFPGHTEFIAYLCHAPTPLMMLYNDHLRVIPLTIHVPLMDIIHHISYKKFEDALTIVRNFFYQSYRIKSPIIAISGFNPHAGEEGQMGTEEQDFIMPWIKRYQEEHQHHAFSLQGPLPADSLFHEEARSLYDIILCWYHDQALIPVKTIDFHNTVNQTIGIPIIRTSPDHGTALNIAGKNQANPASLLSAITHACRQYKSL